MKKLICSPILWLLAAGVCLLIAVFAGLNLVMLLLSILFFLAAALSTIHQFPTAEKLTLNLTAKTEEELSAIDFSVRDILVGTVRTAEQLDYSLQTKQYYVPAKFMEYAPFPIHYIALYEEEVGTEPGIRWIGKINTVELIKRTNIPVNMRHDTDPSETYYQYTVESWQQRTPAISISGTRRGRPAFTCKFLFENCTKSYQLFSITSSKDYRLMCILDHIYSSLYAGKTPGTSYQLSQQHILTFKNEHIFITNNEGWIKDKTSISHFLSNPKSLFLKAKKIVHKS